MGPHSLRGHLPSWKYNIECNTATLERGDNLYTTWTNQKPRGKGLTTHTQATRRCHGSYFLHIEPEIWWEPGLPSTQSFLLCELPCMSMISVTFLNDIVLDNVSIRVSRVQSIVVLKVWLEGVRSCGSHCLYTQEVEWGGWVLLCPRIPAHRMVMPTFRVGLLH